VSILFIGAININKKPRGGEEFKNQLFISILNDDFGLKVIDTTNWKRKPWIFFTIISSILNPVYSKIVVSTSTVSAYRLFNFLNSFFALKLRKIKYFVIGGYLPDGIKIGKLKPEVYHLLGGIVVEGKFLQNKLKDYNIDAQVISNFKNCTSNRISIEHIKNRVESNDVFRFVFLSRMIEDKGIYIILEAVNRLNQLLGSENIIVDFYGPIDNTNLVKFNSLAPRNCVYRGYLDLIDQNSENYTLLSSYHAMLFPTLWYGEGFPGIFIDAFICGLPVICSNNNMNSEIVIDSINGMVLQDNDSEHLFLSMKQLIENKDILLDLSINSFQSFDKFSVDHCKQLIINEISR
jgi:glycosyltransferase involved in cell wall biosynthesis